MVVVVEADFSVKLEPQAEQKVKGGKNSGSPISLPVNRNSRITYFYPAMDELNS